uniref:Secreted protein n=1 Tax=Globodera rostochiensis TaxID=31243 RepID=A0A914HQI8_GLORO
MWIDLVLDVLVIVLELRILLSASRNFFAFGGGALLPNGLQDDIVERCVHASPALNITALMFAAPKFHIPVGVEHVEDVQASFMLKFLLTQLAQTQLAQTQLAQTQLAPRRSWPDAVGPDAVGQTQLTRFDQKAVYDALFDDRHQSSALTELYT